ncbi:MAG: hypothetical protein IPN18_11960 [Ignavibacteriales bacterium]|nr:hypothetical protein [Ignavibacteriales bacterium]
MNSYIEEKSNFSKSFFISLILHILIVVVAFAAAGVTPPSKYGATTVLNMEFMDGDKEEVKPETIPEEKPDIKPVERENNDPVSEKVKEKSPEKSTAPKGMIAGAFDAVDSTLLNLEYKESSLHVKIRYSAGWTFLDNNEKSKLDAVTFWNPNIPNSPWVQLKVVDKYLFRENRYKTKEELDSYTAYYNSEEELEGEVKFEVYLRTDSSEDYIITFRIKGRDAFRQYRPVFMAMLKSFKFGLF